MKNLANIINLPKTWFTMTEIGVRDGMIGEDLRDVVDGRSAGRGKEIYV